jgi:hypothetical protein
MDKEMTWQARLDHYADAYRAGAEAMREACAKKAEAYGWLSNRGCWRVSERQESAFDAADKIASAIRDLPIPTPAPSPDSRSGSES